LALQYQILLILATHYFLLCHILISICCISIRIE